MDQGAALGGRLHSKGKAEARSQWRRDRKEAAIQAAATAMVESGEIVRTGRVSREWARNNCFWSEATGAEGVVERERRQWGGGFGRRTGLWAVGAPETFVALMQFDVSRRMICTGRGWSRARIRGRASAWADGQGTSA